MAGTQYGYANNLTWAQHPILTGPCAIQVQDGGTALIHFGALPNPLTPEVYEGVMHIHLTDQDEIFKYTGSEAIYIRTGAENVSGIYQTSKVVCTPLVNV